MARKKNKKIYTLPGSLIYSGRETDDDVKLKLFRFKDGKVESLNAKKTILGDKNNIDWLSLEGLHNIDYIQKFGEIYRLHPLVLEDILNTDQKPKLEFMDSEHIFVILKHLKLNRTEINIEVTHTALILGPNYVLSFQESFGDNIFKHIEERLTNPNGRAINSKADYIFYSLCDVLVDSYFEILEEFEDRLETLELRIIENPEPKDQKELYNYKRELLKIKRSLSPLRDIFSTLSKTETSLITESSIVYFRDIYDHVLQLLDSLDSERELVDNIQNVYLNNLSQKMNSVMKVLTVFSAIFMPLTFIVGVYGMNFENMPELAHPNGYFYCLAFMMGLSVVLWFYFKWKKYL